MKDEHRRNLIKLIRQVGRTMGLWEAFRDFLQMSALTISNADTYFLATNKKIWDEREKEYLETIKRYSKEDQQLFPKMLAELVLTLDDCVREGHYEDVLGSIFHELELHSKWAGQFFTPQSISDMMGEVVVTDDDKKASVKSAIETHGFCSMNEPACGSGSLILGFLNAFRKRGFEPSRQCLVVASDIDEKCVWMTYLQCSLYGIPAIVYQQNTLSLETYGDPWYSPVYGLEGWRWKRQKAFEIDLREQEYQEFLEILG